MKEHLIKEVEIEFNANLKMFAVRVIKHGGSGRLIMEPAETFMHIEGALDFVKQKFAGC